MFWTFAKFVCGFLNDITGTCFVKLCVTCGFVLQQYLTGHRRAKNKLAANTPSTLHGFKRKPYGFVPDMAIVHTTTPKMISENGSI